MRPAESDALVFFGATGDLDYKQVFPALLSLIQRGQFDQPIVGVAPGSTVETFVALRLYIDNWRWAEVPFYIRAGKCLPVTATEVLVELKRPPRTVFGSGGPEHQPNHLRFRLSPEVIIALGARAKTPGEAPVLGSREPPHVYEPGTWGPAAAEHIIAKSGGWDNPVP